MTTPENFRRRQLAEGVALLILGVWVAFWTFYSSAQNQDTVDCLESKVSELSTAAGARADIVERETAATKKVLLAVPQIQTQKAFDKLLSDYKTAIEDVQSDRKKTPLPPYPSGACDQGLE